MIEKFNFGTITVFGKAYTSDIKIIGGKVVPNWYRGKGHLLEPADIRDILDTNPDVLVVGKGASGMMKISDGLVGYADKNNIRLIAEDSANAVAQFNRICQRKNVCACFHLTC